MKKFIPLFFLIFSISFGQTKNISARGKTNKLAKINLVESSHSGAVPRKISYQGFLTKADGTPTTDGSYEIPEGIISSFPVTCANGDYSIVQGLNLGDFSRERINTSAEELVTERNTVTELGLI